MKLIFLLMIPVFCFSQNDDYNKLKTLPKKELENTINDSIKKLVSLDLWNFLKVIEEEATIDLKSFNNSLIKKSEISNWGNELYFLIKILMEQNTDRSLVQNILNQKKDIWDKGEWSGKFWKFIRENNFAIEEDKNYRIDENGEKKYNVQLYLKEKTTSNQLGPNPLLMINYNLTPYTENQLLETLNNLNIKDIQVTPKDKSVGLFGKGGIDGMLSILTR